MARTAKKTASYSAMHMVVAICVAYALTGSFTVALGIGLVEPLVQTVAYHLHERAWAANESQNNGGNMRINAGSQAAA